MAILNDVVYRKEAEIRLEKHRGSSTSEGKTKATGAGGTV